MITVERIEIDTKKLDKFAEKMNWSVDWALGATSFQVTGLAQSTVPVDTGALKNSLGPTRVKELEYQVGDHVEYGIYVELGTHKMAARPFLVPALRKAIQQICDAVEKEFAKVLG